MRVLVCGDRNWTDRALLYHTLDTIHDDNPIHVVIEGEARGADTISREWAEARGIAVEQYPAQWDRHGRAAGPIRNRQMLVEGRPELVVAFHPDIEASRGTRDMIKQAQRAGVPALLIPQKGGQT